MLSTIIFNTSVNPFTFINPFTVSAVTISTSERKEGGGGEERERERERERDSTNMSIDTVRDALTRERT
jgi:hypothetical protein